MKPFPRFIFQVSIPVGTFGLWWILTGLHIIKPLYLPSPVEVFEAARDASPGFSVHIFATLMRLVVGFMVGTFVGYFLGLLVVISKWAGLLLRPVIDGGRPVPVAVTMPFFLLWFGFAVYGQILFIALAVALIVASGVADACKGVSPLLIRAAQSYQPTKMQLVRTVLMPGLLPLIVPTLRVCLGVAGSLTAVSEMMGAQTGIGVLVDMSRRTLRTESLVYYSLVLTAIVLLCDWILRQYLAYCLRWMPQASEALGGLSNDSDLLRRHLIENR